MAEPAVTRTDSAPATMRRVVVSADSIDVQTADVPIPGAGEVLVHSIVTGVCGSDTHAAHGRHPFITLPYHPGHEVVGVIAQVGDGVDAISPGDRITVEPDLPCWQCKQCRQGTENLCENLRFFGCVHDQGGMADYFTIDARRIHVLPAGMDYRTAALIEPLSTPVHAVRLVGDVTGKAVAILGAGSIGLLLLSVVLAHGAKKVVVTDPLPGKLAKAEALGAHATVDAMSSTLVTDVREALGESADVVFDCVAMNATVNQAVAMADKGGTVAVVGVPAADVTIPLPIIQDHQIRIQGCATYLPEDYAESIDLLQSGAIDVESIVTTELSMDRAAEAFARSADGQNVKVLVVVDEVAFSQ